MGRYDSHYVGLTITLPVSRLSCLLILQPILNSLNHNHTSTTLRSELDWKSTDMLLNISNAKRAKFVELP